MSQMSRVIFDKPVVTQPAEGPAPAAAVASATAKELAPRRRRRRRRLLIFSQVYVPDPACVGQHIADVAAEMVRRGYDVRVYTANRGYDDPSIKYPARETIRGVDIRRLPFSSFGKRSLLT